MESRPQNPEFRNNPENFHPWVLGHILQNFRGPAPNLGALDYWTPVSLNPSL